MNDPYKPPVVWFSVTNGTAYTIPPYAVVKVTSINQSTGIAVVGQVTANGDTAVFFNGASPIPANGDGQVTPTMPAIAAYRLVSEDFPDAVSDPAHGETWGTQAGSWFLHYGQPGFQILGTSGYGLCNVIPQPASEIAVAVTRWNYTDVKTANYTASVRDAVRLDCSGGGFTLYFPAAPSLGDEMRAVFTEPPGINFVTLDGNGANVEGYGTVSIGSAFLQSMVDWAYVGGSTGWAPDRPVT